MNESSSDFIYEHTKVTKLGQFIHVLPMCWSPISNVSAFNYNIYCTIVSFLCYKFQLPGDNFHSTSTLIYLKIILVYCGGCILRTHYFKDHLHYKNTEFGPIVWIFRATCNMRPYFQWLYGWS